MTATNLSAALARASGSGPSDGQLVTAFATDRDPDAFALLVRRHGPMVLSVCRRITGHLHDAEDAFQAVFLTLARRAGAVAGPEAVGNWLYGVAVRTAKQARATGARRRTRETPTDPLPDAGRPDPNPLPAGDRAVLDEELARLPDRYRELVVLCDLEGEPQADLARRLALPVGTVYSRLATARAMLADRLRKRGLAPAAVAGLAAADVPRALAASATQFGSDSPGTVPEGVAALSNGAIRAMTLSKTKTAAVALAALVLLGAGAALAAGVFDARPADQPPPLPPQPAAAPKQPAAGPNRILFFREGKLTMVDSDGANEKTVGHEKGLFQPIEAKLSPDGKRVAVRIKVETPDDPLPIPDRYWLYVRELGEKEPGTWLDVYAESFAWSADGSEIAYSGFANAAFNRQRDRVVHGVVNVTTKKKTPIGLPEDHRIIDWSRDGKYFLTRHTGRGEDEGKTQLVRQQITLHLMNRDGTEHKRLTDEKGMAMFGRLSPDGTRLLFYGDSAPGHKPVPGRAFSLWVLDIATAKANLVAEVPDDGAPVGLCWSPDGKKIAYTWREFPRVKGANVESTYVEAEVRLIVCDPDGKNAKTLATEKDKLFPVYGGIDWR